MAKVLELFQLTCRRRPRPLDVTRRSSTRDYYGSNFYPSICRGIRSSSQKNLGMAMELGTNSHYIHKHDHTNTYAWCP